MAFLKSLGIGVWLTLAFSAHAQTRTSDVADTWQRYQDTTFQEKMFVHTDKESYVAGDLVWFKIYTVNAKNHRPSNLSKIAYVDVVDSLSHAVVQAKIALQNGSGHGSFSLPLATTTGAYTLRAYTNWMKNFGAAHFFQNPIRIINTLKELPPAATDTAASYTIALFPEGGNLVEAIKSTVGIQVTAGDGATQTFEGSVTDQSGATVVHFEGKNYGLGSFQMTPEKGKVYTAHVTLLNGRSISQNLPPAYSQGFVLHLDKSTPKNLTIHVTGKGAPLLQNTEVYLLAHNRQQVQFAKVAQLQDGEATFSVDTSLLKEGITHFTLFDAERKPVCERLYFKNPSVTALPLVITSDSKQYQTRSKVQLSMGFEKSYDSLEAYNLSLAVYQLDTLQPSARTTIDSYLWLTSELSGNVNNPRFYLSNQEEAMDKLMLTQGWRRFRWESYLAARKPVIAYPLEFSGQLVNVAVTNQLSGKPASGVPVYLSIPGTVYQFQVATSDSLGISHFNVHNDYGAKELFLFTDPQVNGSYNLALSNAFAEQNAFSKAPLYTYRPSDSSLLLQHSIGMQVQQLYSRDSLNVYKLPLTLDTVPFYGRPNYSYALDAYTRFQTMEEVLREYVLPINIVQRRGGLQMVLMNEEERRQFNGGELILLDGVPVFDQQKIFSYDPLKIKKIDVITRKYFIGPSLFNGIISFSTYNGGYADLQLDAKVVSVDFTGLQLAREFYAPNYQNEAQLKRRIPDFRNTLYWQPNLKNQKGKATAAFYTSDLKGKFVAEIEGLDSAGNPVSANVPFEVK